MSPAPDPETRVFEFLERHGIPFRRLEIDPEFADTEAFCARYGIAPEISGNTILVASRREPKRHAACVVTATHDRPAFTGVGSTPPCPKNQGF